MKQTVIALLVVAGLVGVGVLAFVVSSPAEQTTTTSSNQDDQNPSQSSSAPEIDTETEFSASEVAEHDTSKDCWTIIEGNVYDVTSFISEHPGGENILSACGVDASSYFRGEQPGAGGGTNDHTGDSEALRQLSSLQIGVLAD